jgi:serine protease inhibitor
MSVVRTFTALCIAATAAAAPLVAQRGAATITGVVRGDSGGAIAGPVILVPVAGRRTSADSLGRFTLDSLPPGRLRVRVVRMGYRPRDTTLVLHPGEHLVLEMSLIREPVLFGAGPTPKEIADAKAANATAGAIDSIGDGLLKPDTARSLSYRAFGARLLFAAIAARGADSTTVVSPISAGTLLSLVWTGARGSTATAISHVLGLDSLGRAAVADRNATFVHGLARRSDVILDMGNAVWVSPVVVPRDEFARLARDEYGAVIALVPLDQPAAVMAINHWVDSVTRGKIPAIVDRPLGPEASMYLANAVYFKGKWLAPFLKTSTRDRDFTLASGQRVRLPMMEAVGRYGYRKEPGYRLLRLPYRGGRVAMYIVLPDSGVSITELERRLRDNGWPRFNGPVPKPNVHVVLPKFHAEQQFNLAQLLTMLGMGIAFDPERADLGDLAYDPRGRLAITGATQKVYIDVDEEGTVAAAATGVSVGITAVPPPPIEFTVDRPFLFLLRDEVSGADLFAGWIAHP